jgi:hypothetical protein
MPKATMVGAGNAVFSLGGRAVRLLVSYSNAGDKRCKLVVLHATQCTRAAISERSAAIC